MKDSLRILIFILIGVALLQNCKKEFNDQPRNDFSADLLILRVIRYPNDSPLISFKVSPKDGNGPYLYTWIMPDTLRGAGPFIVNLVEDFKIMVKITDDNSNQLDFSYVIKKETINSLKVEPPKIDEMIGTYWGETFYESGWSLAGGEITKLNSDTLLMNYWRASTGGPIKLSVTGNMIETKKQIFPSSGHTNNPWHVYFMDYRVSIQGYFRNDSIHYTFEEEIKQEGDSVFRHFDSGRTELHKEIN